MCSQDDRSVLITAAGLTKSYRIWNSPSARLKAPFYARLRAFTGKNTRHESNKYFSDFVALDSVDLELRKGECLGIVGRNGSGKSTLLKILSGILKPSAGEYRIYGKVAALLELGTGFSEDFTGRENVYMNAAIYGVPRKQIERDFLSIEEFAGIGAHMDQKVRTYSSGMVVRLAFSVLVHLKPEILIIDEALAVGDGAFVQKCMRWLKQFVKNHTAILVSHDMAAITQFCNRAIWIENGKIAFSGTPKKTTEMYFETLYATTSDASSEKSQADVDTAIATEHDMSLARHENTLQFFKFDPSAASFGQYRARIHDVRLIDEHKQELNRIQGGETVTVLIHAKAYELIESPIIGFGVKNRQGQELFHENTALNSMRRGEAPLVLAAGQNLTARFTFRMPYFPSGDYFIFAAIATGVHEEHVQQHWVHEAIRFVATPSRIALGLIGLPMMQVHLDKSS